MNPWIAWIRRLSATLLVSSYLLTFFSVWILICSEKDEENRWTSVKFQSHSLLWFVYMHWPINPLIFMHAGASFSYPLCMCSAVLAADSVLIARVVSQCVVSPCSRFSPAQKEIHSGWVWAHTPTHTQAHTHSLHSPAAVSQQNAWKGLTPPETQRGLTCSVTSRSGCCR